MSKRSLLNLSLESDYFELLKEQAKIRGFEKMSDYVREWLIKLGLENKDIKRVILQIPETALVNKELLDNWLRKKCMEISDHYFKETDVD